MTNSPCPIPNPQSPIPNPQSPIPIKCLLILQTTTGMARLVVDWP
ncbi:MAG: hypothetical protein V7L27_19850 [Nostoc sp.]